MIELKVHCDCGQKYKFDVEPVSNQMPFTVACPICKRDGTPKANTLLQQMSVFKQVEPATAMASAAPVAAFASGAPPPVAPAPMAPPPPAGPSKLRINAAAHAEPAPPSGDAPPAIAPVAGSAPPPIGGRRFGAAPVAATDATEPGKKPSFALGLLGAVIGALVGGVIYFAIFKVTGQVWLLRYVLALGVGGLAGWLANFLGKGEGSKELGGLAAILTIIGIVGAQYFLTLQKMRADTDLDNVNQSIADGGYGNSVKEAKKVVAVMPDGTDAQIRLYLAKEQAEDGRPPKLEQVSADDVKEFRDNELTNYQDLASGKLTKEQYWAKNDFDPKKAKNILDTEDTAITGLAAILAVLKAGIFSMIAGAGLAFKLSANA